MKNRFGLAALVLGSAMAVLTPSVASARDRDDYYRYGYLSPHERHELQERERRERKERERWERRQRERDRYYYNNYNRRYGSGYYGQPRGYYDQWGNWRPY